MGIFGDIFDTITDIAGDVGGFTGGQQDLPPGVIPQSIMDLISNIFTGGQGGGEFDFNFTMPQSGGGQGDVFRFITDLFRDLNIGELLGEAGKGMRQNELIEALLKQNYLIPRFKPPVDISTPIGQLGSTLAQAGQTSQGLGVNF